MTTLRSFRNFTDGLNEQGHTMPVLFIGHGSPMNGIEDNEFSRRWAQMGKEIPQPAAVLVVSAHWLTRGTHITAMQHPKTIHDFGGFPRALHEVQYPAPGSPELATATQQLITKTDIGLDHDWGLDHGAWTIIRHMYPDASIPVLQLSIDYYQPPHYHYELAGELAALRKKGVLIIGSGNMVHNLRMVAWDKLNEPEFAYDWSIEMNELFKKHINDGNHQALMDYEKLSSSVKLAIPTPDHYFPLIYTLALQQKNEQPLIFNDKVLLGSLTMTSVKFG
jgi:4,5-DOPA dioxygenase extradiol